MDKHKIVDSLLVEKGRIVGVGKLEELLESIRADCEIFNLDGKTILPGFIDTHSHLSSYAISLLQVSLADVNNQKDLIAKLVRYRDIEKIEAGQWLIANSYDHNKLIEKKHPSKILLDELFPDVNVVLQHQSGHFGVMNSSAIKSLGLEGKDHDGYLEENTWINAIKSLPLPSSDQLLRAYKKAFKQYASYGITTLQDGMIVKQMIPLIELMLTNNAFELDVVGYPEIKEADEIYGMLKMADHGYYKRFRLGGYKMILDGSPQGRTAWMRTPYLGAPEEYGVSSMSNDDVEKAIKKSINDKRQILIHCNGDKASEQLLDISDKITFKDALRKIRPVIIHAQLLAKDQLEKVKECGFILSFFIAHIYHWGDIHIKNFGLERANDISLAHSAKNIGIVFTFHQDTPVIEPNMFETIWCAATRTTKDGVVLGKEECISVEEALEAVTIKGAYQYGEEENKGSLANGKIADFIIVNKNPFRCTLNELMHIQVLQTFKDGICVFDREKE